MKVLIVGNGGREHALLWKLRRDAPDAEFFITRGNGGTGRLAKAIPLDPTDVAGLAGWAQANAVDLTVVGPEVPLALGVADAFASRGLAVFGPTARAAEIESSKAFAKSLMLRFGIPTAGFETFTDLAAAEAHVRRAGAPLVVKASGLAAGKGAVVCQTTQVALATVREMMGDRSLGDAGDQVVVEEFMEGEELSVFALSDGARVIPMLPAQDHKRIGEGETGPNTGGMGAYAPVSASTPEVVTYTIEEILIPTVTALAQEGRPFRGLLYAGLMLTPDGPRVVEFNCRFGDPETQALLPLLDGSLLDPMLAIARGGSVEGHYLQWRPGAAVTTVLASGGYPGDYSRGHRVEIDPALDDADDVLVFHAGTEEREGRVVTSGGRVLAVTGLAPTVAEAAERSRWGAEHVHYAGRYYRRDIGWREIERR